MIKFTSALILLGIAIVAEGFLFPGTGGCGCQPQPACPPNPCGHAKAKGAKTASNTQPLDELELRAQLAGFNLDDPNERQTAVNSELHRLENLGEESIDEAKLTASKKSKNVRFAPQKVDTDSTVMKVDQSTAAPEIVSAEESNTKSSEQKCNSDELKQIIIDNITENSSESKRAINKAAEAKFGLAIDVICSRGHFSYIYSSNLFCEAGKGEVTCIAFKQNL